MITMYTDGSFNAQRNVGGWAAVIISDGLEREYSGGSEDIEGLSNSGKDKATAQRMEIVAVLEGLLTLTEPSDVEVISDSQYVVNTMNEGWLENWIRKKDLTKKHLDLWRIIYTLSKLHNLTFTWVKGHDGNHYNERCDTLAQRQTQREVQRLITLNEVVEEVKALEKMSSSKSLMKETKAQDLCTFESHDSEVRSTSSDNDLVEMKAHSSLNKKDSSKSNNRNKKKISFYAVAKGRKRGVFSSWNECSKNVNRYKGAIFKKFDNEEDALRFIDDNK